MAWSAARGFTTSWQCLNGVSVSTNKWGYPHSWMVYKGNSHWNHIKLMMTGGTTVLHSLPPYGNGPHEISLEIPGMKQNYQLIQVFRCTRSWPMSLVLGFMVWCVCFSSSYWIFSSSSWMMIPIDFYSLNDRHLWLQYIYIYNICIVYIYIYKYE